MFEVFEHTADLGLRVRAATREALFAEATRGLLAIIVANPDAVRGVEFKRFRLDGTQNDFLLFDWLSELLVLFDTQNWLAAECDARFDARGAEILCRGEPLDRQRHELDHEVKAITYHGLCVEETEDGWMAEVIVDL
jgi:SHS2 domain-containing protein